MQEVWPDVEKAPSPWSTAEMVWEADARKVLDRRRN